MAVYLCKVRITNSKYTLDIPPKGGFEVNASSWSVAVYRATSHALFSYKQIRGRRDRPIEIEVTAHQRSSSHVHIRDEEAPNGLR